MHLFLEDRHADARYASFDFCFNYFQSFHEAGNIAAIAHAKNIHLSCLQLGFYLASWGMYRGGTTLLKKSVRYLVPVIEAIANTDPLLWHIDADQYTDSNIEHLLGLADRLRGAMKDSMTRTLVTKIMLGVFGNVPAFDTNFVGGLKFGFNATEPKKIGGFEFKGSELKSSFSSEGLKKISQFYRENATLLDTYRIQTLDFKTGKPTERLYTKAKIIDMVFYEEGRI